MNIESEINRIFKKVFGKDYSDELDRANNSSWDSVRHTVLVYEIEEAFDLEIDDSISSKSEFILHVSELLAR